MALDNVTSHFSTMLEQIASASFLPSLSIIHGIIHHNQSSFGHHTDDEICKNFVSNEEMTSKMPRSYRLMHR